MSKFFQNTKSIKDMPKEFCEETVKIICRIESIHNVMGTMFLDHGVTQMYSVPETMAQILTKELPLLTCAIHRALTEIIRTPQDIQNELVAYRIQTRSIEIVVAASQEFEAVVVHRVKRKKRPLKKL